jgi:hypothetical protein
MNDFDAQKACHCILYCMAIITGFLTIGISIEKGMIGQQGIKSLADVEMSDNNVIISANTIEIEKNKTINAIWRCNYE